MLGTLGARTGFHRNNYKITPGLYGVGSPSPASPVIVTGNYKLSFDHVRKNLKGCDVWLLVVDTRGINVWCAAGKGTFSADEVSYQIHRAELHKIVEHKTVILPQFAAVGVCLSELHKASGFKGKFGPIQIRDLPEFLANGMKASEKMRSVTFSLSERLVLIPVELYALWKPFLLSLIAVGLLSGFNTDGYTLSQALSKTGDFLLATFAGIVAGNILTPALLPFLPGRQLWIKGAFVSVLLAVPFFLFFLGAQGVSTTAGLALFLWIVSSGSFMAMNFTGSTPYTSLSGVEYEMRRGLPVQIVCTFIALLLWVLALFLP